MRSRLEGHFDYFGFAIGVSREIDDAATRCAHGEVIFFIFRQTRNEESFHVVWPGFAVAINHIVDGSLVVLLEDGYVLGVGSDKDLVRHAYYLIFAVFVEDDDVVDIGAVAEELIFL